MEGGALFNPGFLGGSFNWWVGQVTDDKEWRENINDKKIKSTSEIPGWGYRYKVRIIGLHDQDENTLKSKDLPWAQVMYPITSGGGQGGSWQTPAVRQGNFVFGFFMDAQDQQVPVIMGILGANAQIDQENTTAAGGGQNYTPQSGYGGQDPPPDRGANDTNLKTEQPAQGTAATVGSPTAVHQENAADKMKTDVMKQRHPLECPDPQAVSPMKGIQTTLQNLTDQIQKVQSALSSYADAVSSVLNSAGAIADAIKTAACDIAKFLMTIIQLIRDFISDLFSKILEPIFKIAPPTTHNELLDKLIKALELISCIFNKIGLGLCDAAEQSLNNAINRRGGDTTTSPITPPPLPPAGYYYPDPVCSVEEIVGDLIGNNINDIMNGMNAGLLPIYAEVYNTLKDYGLENEMPNISDSFGDAVETLSGGVSAVSGGLDTLSGVVGAVSGGVGALSGGIGAISNLSGGLGNIDIGSLGGFGGIGQIDMGSALSFISAIMKMFGCDPEPVFSANDTHTLKEGGSGKPSKDEPQKAQVIANAASKKGGEAIIETIQDIQVPAQYAFEVPSGVLGQQVGTIQPGQGGGA